MHLLALFACNGGSNLPTPGTATDPSTDPEDDVPVALVCSGGTLPVLQPSGFDNPESDLKVWQDPVHYVQDVLTTDDGTLALYGRFTYGLLEDPIRNEAVEVFVDTCGDEPLKLGTFRTDNDGRIQVDLGSDVVPTYGEHQLVMRVTGDGSRATATLRRFPVGTHVQVFDIDGTLTTSDTELFLDLFSEIGDGSYVPVPRDDASALTQLRVEQGYQVVYLTGRPTGLRRLTTDWLDDLRFAEGSLFLTRRPEQLLPFDDAVGRFKADHVAALRAAGFEVDFAYGNATTDIFAYAQAGVAPGRTMIMGEHGGEAGTIDGGEGYASHLAEVTSEAPVQQPFRW